MTPNPKAKSILEHTIYATLATVDANGNPWNSPVYCVYDDSYNFYWASDMQSQHSQNIRANGKVFIVIYDSTAPWGTGTGVFIQAEAREVTDPEEVAKACQLRMSRVPDAKQPTEDFLGDRPRRIYCATPQHMWTNEDSERDGYFIDVRKEAAV